MTLFFKKKKKILIVLSSVIIIFVIFFAFFKFTYGFNGWAASGKVVYPNECKWITIQVLGFNDYYYTVTNTAAFPDKIGKKVGRITYSGTTIIPSTEYDLYSLKSDPSRKIIAIKTKYGYILATKGEKVGGGDTPLVIHHAES